MTDHYACQKCGSIFWRQEHETWKKLCVSCWKESRQFTHTTSSGDRYSGIDQRLRQELAEWRSRAERAERSLAAHTCPPTALDLATLKRIRLLVHPDKHGGSAVATEISQRINQMIREAS